LGDNTFNAIKQYNKAHKIILRQLYNKVFQAQEASQSASCSKPNKYLYLGNKSIFIYNKKSNPDSDNTSTSINKFKKTDLE
jgi:hypothetical protein